MTTRFFQTVFTPAVKAAQTVYGSRGPYARHDDIPTEPDRLTDTEIAFIAERDSFYLATVNESGWPYVQFRGGAPGFVKVLDERGFGFPDFRGNRQYVSVGNASADNRAAFFFMDYPNRTRLKLLGRLTVVAVAEAPDLADRLIDPDYRAKVERLITVEVEAFDWNCPQHITPRFTATDIAPSFEALKARIAELEAELARRQ
ncbi:MAG: pyridoxamine 5'-phosphate oxidase family protein [Hyphomonadaceae bacterium]|nr:MAG: pyridoxamine 5'-phosphate oxidase-like FMN-binding protein [Caulobacteraceae bacterium]MBT9444543.1 pyridoxamine 5'-phosphate oxidase family protein [Hyphomonadaceae bacterium]TPW06646.1 MAG: pyridoxamine 5'-phosphate oxidase-like FMN-binding protein [Alphaproteobacteria bacterium]